MSFKRILPSPLRSETNGFVLLEAMLAVAIFALAVLGLGKCVTNCLVAERFRVEDTLARRALENRIAQIQSGAFPLAASSEDKLAAPFFGMTLTQNCTPLARKNENGVELSGLVSVFLEVRWNGGGENLSKRVVFYARSTSF